MPDRKIRDAWVERLKQCGTPDFHVVVRFVPGLPREAIDRAIAQFHDRFARRYTGTSHWGNRTHRANRPGFFAVVEGAALDANGHAHLLIWNSAERHTEDIERWLEDCCEAVIGIMSGERFVEPVEPDARGGATCLLRYCLRQVRPYHEWEPSDYGENVVITGQVPHLIN